MMWNMKSGSEDWLYIYTADDERIWSYKPAANLSRWTLRGLDHKVLREYQNSGGTWTVQKDYVYRGGELLAAETPTGVNHLHTDHLGTVRALTNAAGTRIAYHHYFPFGEEATSATQNTERMKFTGHERDLANTASAADDLDYMHARFYNPLTGRFLSLDPKLRVDPITRPQSWNPFSYAQANPLKFVAPDGWEAFVFMVSPAPGDGVKSAFGHAAVWVHSGGKTAGLSYGGRFGLEHGAEKFIEGYAKEGRTVYIFQLKTTSERDQAMIDFIDENNRGGVNRDAALEGTGLVENCTKAVCNTLEAGGVLKKNETANGAATYFHAPVELLNSLIDGELSDDVELVGVIKPEKE